MAVSLVLQELLISLFTFSKWCAHFPRSITSFCLFFVKNGKNVKSVKNGKSGWNVSTIVCVCVNVCHWNTLKPCPEIIQKFVWIKFREKVNCCRFLVMIAQQNRLFKTEPWQLNAIFLANWPGDEPESSWSRRLGIRGSGRGLRCKRPQGTYNKL